jgi:hypothetical protein
MVPKPIVANSLVKQRKHAIGRELDKDPHHLHHNHFHVAEPVRDALSRVARPGQGESHQQGEHDHLKHLAFGHGSEWVAGEDIHQRIGQRRRRLGLIGRRGHGLNTLTGTNQQRCTQAKRDRHAGGE